MKYHIWNTGKQYTAFGQVIVAVHIGGNLTYFYDISRGVEDLVAVNSVAWSERTSFELETKLLASYNIQAYIPEQVLKEEIQYRILRVERTLRDLSESDHKTAEELIEHAHAVTSDNMQRAWTAKQNLLEQLRE
jgi:galactokinase/mevalonate kinase-like predicted kinase